MVTIRNKQTGELKQVDETELGNYGVQKQPGFVEKLVSGPTLPIVGGLLGAGGGSIVGGPGAGTVAGTGIGVAGAKALQNTLMDLLGYQKQKPIEQLGGAVKETATGMSLASLLWGLVELAKGPGSFLFKPGATREKVISNLPPEQKNVPQAQAETAINAPLGFEKTPQGQMPAQYVTPEMQTESGLRGGQLKNALFPFQGTAETGISQPGSVGLDSLYKKLVQWENEVGAWKGNLPAKDIAISVRSLANEVGGPGVQNLNAYMSTLNKLGPFFQRYWPYMVAGTGTYLLRDQLKNLLFGQ